MCRDSKRKLLSIENYGKGRKTIDVKGKEQSLFAVSKSMSNATEKERERKSYRENSWSILQRNFCPLNEPSTKTCSKNLARFLIKEVLCWEPFWSSFFTKTNFTMLWRANKENKTDRCRLTRLSRMKVFVSFNEVFLKLWVS